MQLNGVSYEQVMTAVGNLNNRPGKCLNYKTPYEVFYALTGVNVKNILSCALITWIQVGKKMHLALDKHFLMGYVIF